VGDDITGDVAGAGVVEAGVDGVELAAMAPFAESDLGVALPPDLPQPIAANATSVTEIIARNDMVSFGVTLL
jgi:hypothetical protein